MRWAPRPRPAAAPRGSHPTVAVFSPIPLSLHLPIQRTALARVVRRPTSRDVTRRFAVRVAPREATPRARRSPPSGSFFGGRGVGEGAGISGRSKPLAALASLEMALPFLRSAALRATPSASELLRPLPHSPPPNPLRALSFVTSKEALAATLASLEMALPFLRSAALRATPIASELLRPLPHSPPPDPLRPRWETRGWWPPLHNPQADSCGRRPRERPKRLELLRLSPTADALPRSAGGGRPLVPAMRSPAQTWIWIPSASRSLK